MEQFQKPIQNQCCQAQQKLQCCTPLANKLNDMYATAKPIYFYHLQKQDVQFVTTVLVPGF